MAAERIVLRADDIARTLRRMAHELLERHSRADAFVLVGIRTRGVPLAERLAAALSEIEGTPVRAGSLDVTLYRDDYARTGPKPLGRTDLPDIDGRVVVLVDDVLYTGRTVRAAIDALFDYGRPARVQLAVLVDRGHRELPIRPDYVGKNLPTARDERVFVRLEETDGIDEVAIADAAEPVLATEGGDGP